MTVDEIKAAWDEAAAGPLAHALGFENGALVLGAGTRLALAGAPVDEPALAARLAAAHGRPVEASALRHVRRAIETWREGDAALALTHLALSRLAKLANPAEDARRLFMADALLHSGVSPAAVVKALRLPSPDGLGKYDPDQPRVPAGNGVASGQWTKDDAAAPASVAATRKPTGVQIADLSGTHRRDVASDTAAAPEPSLHTGPDRTPHDSQPIEFADGPDADQTCESFISMSCKASILSVFPGQYLSCTWQEVLNAAKCGDPAARRAKKLLRQGRFRKNS